MFVTKKSTVTLSHNLFENKNEDLVMKECSKHFFVGILTQFIFFDRYKNKIKNRDQILNILQTFFFQIWKMSNFSKIWNKKRKQKTRIWGNFGHKCGHNSWNIDFWPNFLTKLKWLSDKCEKFTLSMFFVSH